MLLIKACSVPLRTIILSSTLTRAQINVPGICKQQLHKGFSCTRRGFKTSANLNFMRRQTVKERAKLDCEQASTGKATPATGKDIVLLTSAVTALGALAYFGPQLASRPGTFLYSPLWLPHVKQRIGLTFAYCGGSYIITALTSIAAVRSSILMIPRSRRVVLATITAVYGTSVVVRRIPYDSGFEWKHLGWLAHQAALGIVLARKYKSGGPSFLRGAIMIFGVIGGFCTIAVCAPNEKFLKICGPLAMGLGVTIVSTLARMFSGPAAVALRPGWDASLCLTVVLTALSLLYVTKVIMKYADALPPDEVYDPINMQLLFPDILKFRK